MSVSLELYATGNKGLEEIDIDSSSLRTENILNVKGDTNSVLWEENITSFLFIKDYSKFTSNRRRCPTYGYLVSLIFPRFVHQMKDVWFGNWPVSGTKHVQICRQFGDLV